MQDYFTKTERIQNYIRNILDDEQKHSTKEIVEYVDGKLEENGEFVFQINSYVNAALRLIMKNEDYAKIPFVLIAKKPYERIYQQYERHIMPLLFTNSNHTAKICVAKEFI